MGVWVCECVSNPTRKLDRFNKIGKLGYNMHTLDNVLKRNEYYFEIVQWTCSDFFGILYIACRHPTKLFETYPLPYLYVGMP